jgi:hypothetical protein
MQQVVLKWSFFALIQIYTFQANAGCISGNCLKGKGTYLYKDGSTYTGTFLSARPHGKGVYYHKDGSTYNGDFYKGEKYGSAKITFQTGDVYTGNVTNGVMSGRGVMLYRNGDTYDGLWENGKSSGQGKYTFKDGDIYTGEFLDGQFSGKGKLTRTDGSYYDGSWMRNKKNGTGIAFIQGKKRVQHYSMNVLVKDESYHVSNVSHASVETVVNNTSTPSNTTKPYKDCTSQYCHAVKGQYRYGDGSVYAGDFKDGAGQGEGECKYANGDKYVGGWKNHSPHGKGTMYFASGNTYAAIWDNGVPKQKIVTVSNPVLAQNNKPDFKKSSDAGKTQIYALIVGVATYNHMPSLKYTDDDAYQLYAFLRSPEGGAIPDDNIKILIDDAATQKTIRKELASIAARADKNDVVMLYMSGHGLDGAYVPSDFDGHKNHIPYGDILNVLNTSAANHKLFITDACHSGSMIASARTPLNVAIDNFYNAYNTIDGGTAIMMSSKKEEVSLEYGGLRQGIFSHFLIKGLKGNADKDGDKLINITELYNYVAANVKSYTANAQNPTITGDYDKSMPVGLVR